MDIKIFNNMSLVDARVEIINRLVTKDSDIDKQLERLRKDLAQAEQKLINARNEGDASENSSLEDAINEVQCKHGEIDSLMVLKGRLDTITEYSYLKSKYDYKTICDILNEAKGCLGGNPIAAKLLEVIGQTTNLYDSLYNLKASDVESVIIFANTQINRDSLTVRDKELLSRLDSLYKISSLRKYKPTGIVLEYSTVRVRITGGSTDIIMTGLICPEGISFIEDGIFAANSSLAKALIGNSINGNRKFMHGRITYELLELY